MRGITGTICDIVLVYLCVLSKISASQLFRHFHYGESRLGNSKNLTVSLNLFGNVTLLINYHLKLEYRLGIKVT